MKKIVILSAAIFCVGGLTNAGAAAPSMDLSHHHHHTTITTITIIITITGIIIIRNRRNPALQEKSRSGEARWGKAVARLCHCKSAASMRPNTFGVLVNHAVQRVSDALGGSREIGRWFRLEEFLAMGGTGKLRRQSQTD